MFSLNLLIFGSGLIALTYALWLTRTILALPQGTNEMRKISAAIQEGASAFLRKEYSTIALVAAIIAVLLFRYLGALSALGFLTGAAFSALAGYIGMNIAVRANVRVAQAARGGLKEALSVAFRGGAVTGLLVVGLGIIAVGLLFVLTGDILALVSLGFGGSLISVFARLGGGIYTKAADIGADLVGKVEEGIPEDDPRNPAVIADLVGDNVGDCAGMAADLFETYAITIVAAIILGTALFPQFEGAQLYPLAIGAVSILASIGGTFFVRLGKGKTIMPALYRGMGATVILASLALYPLTKWLMGTNPLINPLNLYLSALLGMGVALALFLTTEYFTGKGFKPVRSLVQASATGAATNIISGLALSLKSTFIPILVIAFAILASFTLAGLYDAQGRYAQAEPLYQQALAIVEKALRPDHPDVARVLENYAALLHKLNRDAEADKMEARAQAIRAQHAQEIPQR